MKKAGILMLALALLLSGCSKAGGSMYSNRREIERLQSVQVLGLDSAGEGIRLSLSCALPSEEGAAVLSREGGSFLQCLRSLENYAADRELYYAHAQYLLLGEDFAREGAEDALDFAARDTQLRLGIELFAVRGDALELISGPEGQGYEISKTLSGIERDSESQGLSRVFTCRETIKNLSQYGAALVCAISPAETEGSVFPEGSGITAVPVGYGILRGDSLVGWIEPEISQAANIIMGKPGSAGPSLSDGKGGEISFEYSGGGVKIIPAGKNRLRIEAEITATLAEPDTATEHITDSEMLSALEKALARDMEEKMAAVLGLYREYDADFLGLGSYLEERDHLWPGGGEFETVCRAKIDYTRELADKMDTEGGGT